MGRYISSRQPANFHRGSRVRASDVVVEAAQTPEAGREGDISDGKRRFIEQPLGEMRAAGEGYVERRGSQVLQEEATQMSTGDPEPIGQLLDALVVDGAVADES
jgi:hypothetical protein